MSQCWWGSYSCFECRHTATHQ